MTSLLVLNIDDEIVRCTARTALLRNAGYRVADVHGGDAALEFLKHNTPALILLDVSLAETERLDLCRCLKEGLETSSTPILQIVSPDVEIQHQVASLESGTDSFLFRPVDDRIFLATVRALLRLCRAERDLHQANLALKDTVDRLAQANEALHNHNEEMQHFSYMATHDLQTPLRTISSFATLLQRQYHGKLDEKADQHLDFIQSGINRMAAVIEDLLYYAQAAQDESHEPVKLADALNGTLNDLKSEIDASGAEISISHLPVVKGNPVQITRVFQNLVGNAMKYRKPDEPPRILIQAERDSDRFWKFSVKDNGIGVEQEHQQMVFLPFKRLHGEELPGTGIGLATCRRIVEKHGGRIWLESVGVGKGSTFWFTLPDCDE